MNIQEFYDSIDESYENVIGMITNVYDGKPETGGKVCP